MPPRVCFASSHAKHPLPLPLLPCPHAAPQDFKKIPLHMGTLIHYKLAFERADKDHNGSVCSAWGLGPGRMAARGPFGPLDTRVAGAPQGDLWVQGRYNPLNRQSFVPLKRLSLKVLRWWGSGIFFDKGKMNWLRCSLIIPLNMAVASATSHRPHRPAPQSPRGP